MEWLAVCDDQEISLKDGSWGQFQRLDDGTEEENEELSWPLT